MRSYFKMCPDDTGVLVAKVLKLSCSHGYLKKGDILMSLDGNPIAENGTVCRLTFISKLVILKGTLLISIHDEIHHMTLCYSNCYANMAVNLCKGRTTVESKFIRFLRQNNLSSK